MLVWLWRKALVGYTYNILCVYPKDHIMMIHAYLFMQQKKLWWFLISVHAYLFMQQKKLWWFLISVHAYLFMQKKKLWCLPPDFGPCIFIYAEKKVMMFAPWFRSMHIYLCSKKKVMMFAPYLTNSLLLVEKKTGFKIVKLQENP